MFSRSTFSLIRTATKSTTTVAAMRNATRGFATVATNTVRSQQQNLIGVGTGCFLGVGLIQFVDQKVGISPNSPAINPQTEARTLSAAAAAEKEPPSLMKKCIAEAIGTGIIVAGGCGAVAASKYAGGGMGLLGVAISFGASVTLAVYSTANISGAHLNPAVTLNAVVNGGFDAAEGAAFSVAQMVGATLASGQ